MNEQPPDPAYAQQLPTYGPPAQPWASAPPQAPPVQYHPPTAPPSAVTAILTGVVGILAGLGFAVFGLLYFSVGIDPPVSDLGEDDWLLSYMIALAGGATVSALLLILGSVLVLARKLFGRWLLAAGVVAALAFALTPVVFANVADHATSDLVRSASIAGRDGFELALMTCFVALPLVATVFAFLPPTDRYCTTPGR